MLGTRNIAFPRLNAFGYWVYLFGGIMLYVAFFLNVGPDAGWFSYVPLAGPEYSPGKRVTYQPNLGWDGLNLLATLGGVVLTLGVLVFIVNALKSRRAGALAGANPWGAATLEWATSSPPPAYNFLYLPT